MAASAVDQVPTGTVLAALRSRNFALLWTSSVISEFGDKVTLFALAVVTWEITGSALFTTLAVVITSVPYAVFGLFAGAIADATGHRRSMVACDVIRTVAIAPIPIALALDAPLLVPYVLVFLSTVCGTVATPARVALVPSLLPREQLGAGNSLIYASERTVEIAGALLAGIVVAFLAAQAFYVDALTFGVSAFLLSRIAVVEAERRSVSWSTLAADAAEGLRAIRRIGTLWANTIFSLVAQLSVPVFNALLPVLVFREFGLGAGELGAADAALAVGAVGAGIVLPSFLSRAPKGRLLIVGFAGLGLAFLAVAVAPNFSVLLGLCVLVGVTNVLFYVPNVTISQEITPPELRGRVFGARIALLNISWLPIILMSGAAADVIGVSALIAAAGILTLGTAIVGALLPAIRDVA